MGIYPAVTGDMKEEMMTMKKVLVVEDDRFLGSAYKAKLVRSGFDVQLATDGDEALTALQSFAPDIILLDLVMPNRDGFSALEAIRQNPATAGTPVIVASNLGQKEDLDRAMALGANDFIIKSDISLDELIARIQKHIKPETVQ
jgi:PleD family two-component response regulator